MSAPDVINAVEAMHESFITDQTNVGTDSRMRSYMTLQMTLVVESFTAELTVVSSRAAQHLRVGSSTGSSRSIRPIEHTGLLDHHHCYVLQRSEDSQ